MVTIWDSRIEGGDFNDRISKLEDLLTGSGCEIFESSRWGRRKLAYEIKKNYEGLYMFHVFESSRDFISKLDKELRLDSNILRHLVVSADLSEADIDRMKKDREKAKEEAKEEAEQAEKQAAEEVPAKAAAADDDEADVTAEPSAAEPEVEPAKAVETREIEEETASAIEPEEEAADEPEEEAADEPEKEAADEPEKDSADTSG